MLGCDAMKTALALAALLVVASTALGCGAEDPGTADEADLKGRPALGPEPAGDPTRYPIVLVSGFATSPTLNNFRGVPDGLTRDGHRVFVANLPPYDSAEVRGAALAAEIDRALEELDAPKVNVIAHSMGGLDAREAIRLGLGDRIASLTTISSPHRGSKLGDLALDLGKDLDQEAINAFVSMVGANISTVADDSHLRAAFESLAERNADAFNASHPDDPRVAYQSWAGVAGLAGIIDPKDEGACEHKRFGGKVVSGIMHPLLVPMAAILGHTPQDTLVTVESAKHGEFLGCLPGDHLDEVGDAFSDGVNKLTGFDRVRFYRLVAFDLAAQGF